MTPYAAAIIFWYLSHMHTQQKTDKENPRWFMVDLTFKSRAKHFVPLALLKRIVEFPSDQVPEDVSYIGLEGCKAIQGWHSYSTHCTHDLVDSRVILEMDLVTRGRLSVQRVSESAWTAIELLADRGGWDESSLLKKKKHTAKRSRKKPAKDKETDEQSGESGVEGEPKGKEKKKPTRKRKRKAPSISDDNEDEEEQPPRRKSSRL